MSKIPPIFCTLIILSSLFTGIGMTQNSILSRLISNRSTEKKDENSSPLSATLHDPININGNAALASFCSGNGNGTISNPYFIANLEIESSSNNGVFIQNTSAYLIIENCVINYGIYLNHTENIIIFNNTLIGKSEICIVMDTSNNNILLNNTCIGSNDDGLCIEFGSYNNEVIGNNITTDNSDGIFIGFDTNYDNLITDNTFISNNGGGVVLDSGAINTTVFGNICASNTREGIALINEATNNSIIGNNCHFKFFDSRNLFRLC